MPDLSSLIANKCWVDVEVEGGTFKVAYRPGGMSLMHQAELLDRVEQLQARTDMSKAEQARNLAELTCEVIVDWDLTDNGEPLPLTPDTVAKIIPGTWTMPIVNAVMKDGGPNQDEEEKKQLSATSVDGLPQAGKREVARNGIRQFEPRGTWAL